MSERDGIIVQAYPPAWVQAAARARHPQPAQRPVHRPCAVTLEEVPMVPPAS